jgi:poly(hydroxyalkanoate) depolymerase family esterase
VVETPTEDAPAGQFIAGSFMNASGKRDYKLYIPSGAITEALPLIVMLHGCKQNPDDFAAGTRMNLLADSERCFVLYPAQTKAANGLGCWNWFRGGNQQRDLGEPSIIAGMTREVIATHPIDPKRVHVAGLSAGGAMSAIMASAYPELYAAVGVHSGLAHGAAHDVMSAFAAMREGPAATRGPSADVQEQRAVPTIVFHGDRDATVHPSNGDHVIAQAKPAAAIEELIDGVPPDAIFTIERGQVAGGHAYTRTIHRDAEGRSTGIEHWVVHGAGHAWSGGSAKGSYTDPKGPDASREMLRFFADHPMP